MNVQASSPPSLVQAARRALAERFQLPYDVGMQDWEWEVADGRRTAEFVAAYVSGSLSAAERICLMEVILQGIESLEEVTAQAAAWALVRPTLLDAAPLHRATIDYWARTAEGREAAMFSITPMVRALRGKA